MLASSSLSTLSTSTLVPSGITRSSAAMASNAGDRVSLGNNTSDPTVDASRQLALMARQNAATTAPAPPQSNLYAKVHPVTVTLQSDVPTAFLGAKVTTMVDNDGSLEKDADLVDHLRQTVEFQIKSGRILVTTPGQTLTTKDMFDAKGHAYLGVLKYNADGTKTIERLKIAQY